MADIGWDGTGSPTSEWPSKALQSRSYIAFEVAQHMKDYNYILDADGNPIPAINTETWAVWFENIQNRRLGYEKRNGVEVSTVFLGIDHNFGRHGPPILWETLIRGGKHNDYMDRYASKEDALKGHAAAVKLAFGDTHDDQPKHE